MQISDMQQSTLSVSPKVTIPNGVGKDGQIVHDSPIPTQHGTDRSPLRKTFAFPRDPNLSRRSQTCNKTHFHHQPSVELSNNKSGTNFLLTSAESLYPPMSAEHELYYEK